jgi:hypothetical protein
MHVLCLQCNSFMAIIALLFDGVIEATSASQPLADAFTSNGIFALIKKKTPLGCRV